MFGKRLREQRKLLGLTQRDLMDRTGVASAYISQIENGRGNPTLDLVLKLAEAVELQAWVMLRPS
jgi:hypothetical protein